MRTVERNLKKAKSRTLKFDHQVLRAWRDQLPINSQVLVAVSGGLDSMVLADFLLRWCNSLRLEIAIAHVHHGSSKNQQGRFRDRAANLVRRFAVENNVMIYTNDSTDSVKPLKSEADFRQFRWENLRRWQKQWGKSSNRPVFIATAHTADDLVETQILRLLRGTGPDGLQGMSARDSDILRPLLLFGKSELAAAAAQLKLKWVEDPSNKSLDPFRNWLRQKWFTPLKKRWPQALPTMSRSLQNIATAAAQTELTITVTEQGLRRQELMHLSRTQARRTLAQYFRSLGLHNYGQGHIDEILKRLDTGRRDLTFELLGYRCVITNDWVALRPD